MLIDSHCHLDLLAKEEDLQAIIKRARESGVEILQTICTKLSDTEEIIKIIEKFDIVYGSVGVHPSEVKENEIVNYNDLINIAKHPKIIGLGETGLDYYHATSSKAAQITSFIEHIKAAKVLQLPVIIHTRDAEEDTLSILQEEMKYISFPALIHCFTASMAFAKQVLDLGLYISISGIVTFKNAKELQEIVRFIPIDRLLIETDSPYLAPVPMRGKRNEPAFVKHVAQHIAELKNIDIEQLHELTKANFFKLFSKCKKVG
ncbi:MAG: TatD family deoxyribonuclease [Rickettsiaceae bacterium]|nr:MAG: TatD family deoxyribonuclease [Rickettsiaceae bacterium]